MINSNPLDKKSSSDVVFAVDLGGTHLRAALVDEDGIIRFRFKQNTPRTESPDDIVQAIVAAVRSCELDGPASAVSVVVPELSTLRREQLLERPTFPLSIGFVYQQLSSANSSYLLLLKTTQTLRRSGSFGRAPVVVATPSFV